MNLPDSGFFDSLALGTGLLPGASLGGFLVEFDWLGVGAPGAQSFTIVDPSTFATLDSGLTSLVSDPPTGVPEPSTLGLLVLGLAGIAARRRELHIGLCV